MYFYLWLFLAAEWLGCEQAVVQWEHSPACCMWTGASGNSAATAEKWSGQQPQELPQ